MKISETRCDRCNTTLPESGGHIKLVVQYHHSKTLDLCSSCEAAFTVWLGKHPLTGEPADAGGAGRGWPTPGQVHAIANFKAEAPGVLMNIAERLLKEIGIENEDVRTLKRIADGIRGEDD